MSFFGGDPGVVGRTIRLADGPGSLVVGIAPETFAIPSDADLYVAMAVDNSIGHMYDAYVRLAPGVTPEIVQPRLTGMWNELARQYPDQAKNRVFVLRPLLDAIVGDVGPVVLMAFTATGLLLLLAMVNVANLLLARAPASARDGGACRPRRDTPRPVRASGVGVTAHCRHFDGDRHTARLWDSPRDCRHRRLSRTPRADGMRLDVPVFLFAAAVMMLAGLVVGLARSSRQGQDELWR